VTGNIDALKSHALINDIHLEAFAPMQIAAIAYEVGKGLTTRINAKKYNEHFAENVFPDLEKNCLAVCDPKEQTYLSDFKKMQYTLDPKAAKKIGDTLNVQDEIK
jgi:hypothetical protein